METENILTGLVVIPALAWLGLTVIHQGKKLIVLGKTQDDLVAKVDGLVESFDRIQRRMDLFLKSEIDVLKEISLKMTDSLSNHKGNKRP